MHRLCYLPVFKWFAKQVEMQNTIKEKMDETCHMKYTDLFYQLLIKSMLTYLTGVYGQAYMAKKPSVVLGEQKANKGERTPLDQSPHKALPLRARIILCFTLNTHI